MKYIDELLKGHEVVWKELGEVFSLVTDFTAAGSFASNAANVQYKQEKSFAQLVRTTDLKSKFKNTDKFVYVDEHAYEYLWRVNLNEECLVLSNVGNCGEVYYIIPEVLPYAHNVLGPNALLLRTTLGMNKFFYYWFLNSSFQNELGKITSNTGQTKFNKTNLKKILIPLPPLSVQEEIVRILDKFTTLEAELEAELDCRKRQYEFYRNQLLSFENGAVEWKSLKEIAVNFDAMRKPITSGAREKGTIPYYGASGVVDHVKGFIFDGDYLLVSEDGANLIARTTPIAFSIRGKSWVNNHAHVLKFNTYEERRFVEYYLNSIDLMPYISGAAQPKLNQKNLNKIKIPSPSLVVQQRIVTFLDKFDTLVNSISEGLPKEIELRRKQYEYYREQLLSFRH